MSDSIARRMGGGSIGHASMTFPKSGSVGSISMSRGAPDLCFSDGFSDNGYVSNLPDESFGGESRLAR